MAEVEISEKSEAAPQPTEEETIFFEMPEFPDHNLPLAAGQSVALIYRNLAHTQYTALLNAVAATQELTLVGTASLVEALQGLRAQ